MTGFIKKRMLITMFILAVSMMTASCGLEKTENTADYDKNYLIEKYGSKLDSKLLIFPDNIGNARQKAYKMSLKPGLFDAEGYIIVDCVYNKSDYDAEVARISSIVNVVEEENTNKSEAVIYLPADYYYPAYSAIDGLDKKYEYAMLNEDNNEIVYVYISDINLPTFQFGNYLKNDRSAYDGKGDREAFSIYD